MNLSARSLATLGLGFGALAIVTLGFTPADAAVVDAPVSQLHQGGPDAYGGGGARQYVDDLHPQHLIELERAHATPAPLVAEKPKPETARLQPDAAPRAAPAKESATQPLHASELLYHQANTRDDAAIKRQQDDDEALIFILSQL